mgnify:CR=1 FL=1
MTQRDGMGREVVGGFMMGNTCTPMVDSCQCMAKPIRYCKVKKKLNNKENRNFIPNLLCIDYYRTLNGSKEHYDHMVITALAIFSQS